MEVYKIPDTQSLYFRYKDKVCEAKIENEDRITIYNHYPDIKWDISVFSAFVFKALECFNTNGDIDKYLESVSDKKVKLLDLSSSINNIKILCDEKVFSTDYDGFMYFGEAPYNYTSLEIKTLVNILDYINKEYELEDLDTQIIPIANNITNISKLESITKPSKKTKENEISKINLIEVEPECTIYPMIHINIKTFDSIKDIFYKETGIILDDFILMEVDQLTRCNTEKYEIQKATVVANNNYNHLMEQFFKDLCNNNKVMLMTNPEILKDTLDIIINVTAISSIRYCFRVK